MCEHVSMRACMCVYVCVHVCMGMGISMAISGRIQMYAGLLVGCMRYAHISACSHLKTAHFLLLSIGLQQNSILRTEEIQSFPLVH